MVPIKRLVTDPAIRSTFIVTTGIFLGSVFSYFLQIGLGRLLSIEDFGTFNALLSLSIVTGIPAGAISTALIKKVAELLAQNDFYTLRKLFISFVKISLAFGITLALLVTALSSPISTYLNITHKITIFAFALSIAFSFLNVAPQSYLQGLLRFKAFSFYSAVSLLLRFVVPIGLVYAGFAIAGVYVGVTISVILSFFMAITLLSKNLRMGDMSSTNELTPKLDEVYKKLLAFSMPVLLISTGVSLLNNMDIILAKHFLTSFDAGIYAGISAMGKVFLYGAGMVQVVMFPQIAHLHASNGDYQSRFKKFLALQLILIVAGMACFVLFPALINTIMFGGKFAASVPYLPLFAVFTAFYILLNFMSIFLLAINKTKAFFFILPACLLQFLLINTFHSNITSILKADILVSAIASLFITIYVVLSIRPARNGKIAI